MLNHALTWLNQGIAPIPVYYRSKYPVVHWRPYQQQLPTETDITKWFRYKWRNLAIVTGWQGLTVLDFDSFAAYTRWCEWAIQQDEAQLVARYTKAAVTARGVHIYIRTEQETKCSNLALIENEVGLHLEMFNPLEHAKGQMINIKGRGGLCTTPPSVHPSGLPYNWLNNNPIIAVSSLEAILPPLVIPYTEQPTVQASTPWDNANRLACSGSVSEIKQRVSILDFFPGAEKSGDHWYKTLCPFHKDRKPSMWIDTQSGLCGCYLCGFKPMDVINLHARLRKIDNRAAIDELSNLTTPSHVL